MGQVCVLNPDQESRQKAHRHWPEDIRLVKTLVAPACTTHSLYIGRHIHSCLVTMAECRQGSSVVLSVHNPQWLPCDRSWSSRLVDHTLHNFIACWSASVFHNQDRELLSPATFYSCGLFQKIYQVLCFNLKNSLSGNVNDAMSRNVWHNTVFVRHHYFI